MIKHYRKDIEPYNPLEYDVSLLKITFTFDKRWYEKYDIFKLKDIEYICISRPRKNEDNTWSIDVIPSKCKVQEKDTEFLYNTVSEFFQ